jgi:endogenous inhibitor of DNA gyrase (YacG/DUF329 family)
MAGFIEMDPDNPRTILVIGPHDSTMVRDGPLLSARDFTCGVCNKIFHSKQSYAPKYCSHTCKGIARRVLLEIPCPQCRKLFRRRTASQQFCSHSCKVVAFRAVPRKTKSKRPDCRICGKPLSRLGYVLCRTCWLNGDTSVPAASEFAPDAMRAFKLWSAA